MAHRSPSRSRWRSSSATSSFVCRAAIRSFGAARRRPRSARRRGRGPSRRRGARISTSTSSRDERSERALVAQGVVDGEADALVVAAGAEAADRLDDAHVRGRVAALRGSARRARRAGRARPRARRSARAPRPRGSAPARRRARARGSGPRARSARAGARGRRRRSRAARGSPCSGMKRSSWSCLISRMRSTNSGG